MANKYLEQVQVDVRQQLPSLQGLNIDPHIAKARSGSSGMIGQSLAKMAGDLSEYHMKLNQSDVDKSFREAETEFIEGMTQLPTGWAGTKEGLDQYDKLLQAKINRNKATMEEYRTGVGKEFYDNYQMKISETAAKDFYTAKTQRDKFLIQDATYRQATQLGNMGTDIMAELNNNAAIKRMNGQPISNFDEQDLINVNGVVNRNIRNIMDNNGTSEDEKTQQLRQLILNRESTISKYWFDTKTQEKNMDYVLRVDGVAQRDLDTGDPIMDESMISKVISEDLKTQEEMFKNGSFKNQLMQDYGLNENHAEDLTKVAYSQFTQRKLEVQKTMDGRAMNARQRDEQRMLEAQKRQFDASEKAKKDMANNFNVISNINGAYQVLNGVKMDPATVFTALDKDGSSEFENVFGTSVDELNSSDNYIADMFSDQHVQDIKLAGTSEEVAKYIINDVLKGVEKGPSRDVAIRSLAHKARQAKLPLNYRAFEELAKPLEKDQNPQMRSIITSIVSYEQKPFDDVPTQNVQLESRIASTEQELLKNVGGPTGKNILMRHIKNNQDALAPYGSTLSKNLIAGVRNGKISERDFELAVLNTIREDSDFAQKINGFYGDISTLAQRTPGQAYTVGSDQKQMLIKKAGMKAAEDTRRGLEQFGISGRKVKGNNASGRW